MEAVWSNFASHLILLTMIPVWKKAPFFRLLLPLIAGIITEYYFPLSIRAVSFIGLIVIFVWIIFQSFSSFQRFRYGYVSGVFIHIGIFFLGLICTMCHELRFDARHFSIYSHNETTYVIRIEEPPIEKAKTYRAMATVKHILHGGNKIQVNGRCYVYFKKGEKVKGIQYASLIHTNKTPLIIPIASDTASFNFQKYAALQGIHHQLYLKEEAYIITGIDSSFSVYQYLYRLRAHLIATIHQYIPHHQYTAVAIALLTGYRQELDRDTTQMYQSTGTIHVIAISGMHLALIYLLLQFVFRFLEKSKNMNIVKELFILILLWLFSLLTGGGASVIRAVVMFTFISFGKMLGKKGGIENALAVSAFFMLCYNPYLLWDIGFQLSYAAVMSLVIFMKPVYEIFILQNPILDALWKMNAVTLSAQILTLPLCVYHFHQLPVLFLPANMMAVPLSTLALYGLLLLMGFNYFNEAGYFIGKIISVLIHSMNAFMEYLARFRFAVIEGLAPNVFEIILLYMLIYFVFAFYKNPGKPYLLGGLMTLFVLGLIQSIQFFST